MNEINNKRALDDDQTPDEPEYVEQHEDEPFELNEEDDEDDGLGLDFIAQVQKEKTEQRASQPSEPALPIEPPAPETSSEFGANNYWKVSPEYSLDDLLGEYS